MTLQLKTSNKLNLFNEDIAYLFKKSFDIYTKLDETHFYNDTIKYYSYVYNYIFTQYVYHKNKKQIINNFLVYKPITRDYFRYNEMFKKYNITIKNKKISYISSKYALLEYLTVNNFNLDNLYFVNLNIHNIYFISGNNDPNYDFYNIFKSLHPVNVIKYKNKNIYSYIDNIILPKSDIIVYNRFDFYDNLIDFEDYYNYINILTGFIMGLKYLNKGGILILYISLIVNKPIADIYILGKKLFNETYIFNCELNTKLKKNGVYYVFKDFKGISDIEINKLLNIYNTCKKKFPDYIKQFNILDKDIRNKYKYLDNINNKITLRKNITKPINNKPLYITDLISEKIDNELYNDIKLFNYKYFSDMIDIYYKIKSLSDNYKISELKEKYGILPTKKQIISSIFYCRKWNIKYFQYYDNKFNRIEMNKEILNEMYGLLQPLKLIYKTPSTFKKVKFTKKYISKIINNKTIKKTNKKKKLLLNKKKSNKLIKLSNDNKKILNLDLLLKTTNSLKDVNIELKNNVNYTIIEKSLSYELENINTRIHQVMLSIDSRRDYSISNKKKQLINYYKGNVAFRYFKHGGRKNKQDAAMYIRNKLNNNNITQAWLKMYEILSDCNIINKKLKKLNSFHICEAPGSFIDAINNYIQTKTNIKEFNWYAQSLNNNNTKIKDQLGIIKRTKKRWDFGHNNGDITNIKNIIYYANKYGNNTQKLHLITSDCGIAMDEPGYDHIAFSSLLSMMYILSLGGNLVYKILTPITSPLIWNLIYLCYEYFDELIFFKPVQNSQSREFYMIAKNYKKTNELIRLLELLFKYVKKYDENADIFNDKYPETFVIQTVHFMNDLSNVFIKTIEKQIYYSDNYDNLTKTFRKMANDYLYEKIEDWITMYKPIKINNNL